LDALTRSHVRQCVSDAARVRAGAEILGGDGLTNMLGSGSRNSALPIVAWEACEGDPLLALDVLKMKQESAKAA